MGTDQDLEHPAIACSRAILMKPAAPRRRPSTNADPRLSTVGRRGAFPVRVRAELVDRALAVAAMLVDAAGSAGWPVRAHEGGSVVFVVEERPYQVRVEEPVARHLVSGSARGNGVWDYEPSGRLSIVIPARRGSQGVWQDGKRWWVEEKVDQVVEVLAGRPVLEADDERRWQERREEQERERVTVSVQQQREKALEAALGAWERAERIRGWLRAATASLPADVDPTVTDWLEWVSAHADQLDPRRSRPAQACHCPPGSSCST